MICCSINTFVFVTLMPTVVGDKYLKDLVIYQLIQIFFEEHSTLKAEPGEEHARLEGGGLKKSTHRKKNHLHFFLSIVSSRAQRYDCSILCLIYDLVRNGIFCGWKLYFNICSNYNQTRLCTCVLQDRLDSVGQTPV